MSDKDDLPLDDSAELNDAEDLVPSPIETAKTNLTKRRVIDNLLEERRLKKQLAEYDFDI